MIERLRRVRIETTRQKFMKMPKEMRDVMLMLMDIGRKGKRFKKESGIGQGPPGTTMLKGDGYRFK